MLQFEKKKRKEQITVESAYLEVIRVKKGLRIILNSNYKNT